jgi:serine/threonine-protein kinase PpkA
MTTILIVEDDDTIRNNLTRLLMLEGYEILSATNGLQALELLHDQACDLVISDVSMPQMDGFELLETVRGNPDLASIPFMLLTALDDRANMRRGMTAGADDYLAKPFSRDELLQGLQGLLKKRERMQATVLTAVSGHEERLRLAFAASLGAGVSSPNALDLPSRVGLAVSHDAVVDQVLNATVLFSDIRNFTSLADKLTSSEVAELLSVYFDRACEPILKNGGRHLKFIGDGVMTVFADTLSGSPLPAARRGISAALAIALAAHEFRSWLQHRFADRGLPPFAIGVGLHTGEVSICRIGSSQSKETTPIGDAVNVAARLEGSSKELGWTVVASQVTLKGAGDGVQTGGMTSLEVRGRGGYVDVAEITGLVTDYEDRVHGMASLTERAAEISASVKINSEITARAVKGALTSALASFRSHSFKPGDQSVRLKGYRLTRKLAEGGMTGVYLAVRESDGMPVVLKILDAAGKASSNNLSRFIQEYALMSKIDHPNVIRIYDQGFTDDHAYIAMEFFENGDLRRELSAGMTQVRVLHVMMQVTGALSTIHASGIIHRDLKPENLMLRADGSVAVADFGIAKATLLSEDLALTRTHHGEVVGTPYYLSPEQAAGRTVDARADLYSLGVMMYEMLTGMRPYKAETLELLLAHHLNAPTPELPAAHVRLQPLLNSLMAKNPDQRPLDALQLLQQLKQLAHITSP